MNEERLYIIVPCYNEEKVLPITSKIFINKLYELIRLNKISDDSRILFVNDGSDDKTWDIIKELSVRDKHYIGLSCSRNRGHQNAVIAGLMESINLCEMTVSIDCDGQDDIEAIELMIDAFYEGNDIVYGVRNNRDTDSFLKRFTANAFYHVMNKMGVECVENHADYRLISNRALKALAEFKEVNLFLRGMIPLVGFKSTCVYYKRKERIAGRSHYPLSKMVALAVDGITSMSIKPIRMIAILGFFVSILGFGGILWSILLFFAGDTITGWASVVCIICFIGGVQLLSLGIIGEYIGKTYLETKKRPRYIIDERTVIIKDETNNAE